MRVGVGGINNGECRMKLNDWTDKESWILLIARRMLRDLAPAHSRIPLPEVKLTHHLRLHSGQYHPDENRIEINLNSYYMVEDTYYVVAHEWAHWNQFNMERLKVVTRGDDVEYALWLGTGCHHSPQWAAALEVNHIEYPDSPWEVDADLFAYHYCNRMGYPVSLEAEHRYEYIRNNHRLQSDLLVEGIE